MPFTSEAGMKEVLVSGKDAFTAYAREKMLGGYSNRFWSMDSYSKE